MNEGAGTLDSEVILSTIPSSYWGIPYSGKHHPGGGSSTNVFEGANCQSFAYAVLRLFGRRIPDFRFSDLWLDRGSTIVADEPRVLDLALFGGGENAWGAHVGVYLGDGRVLHLCKEEGFPALWTLGEFRSRPRYRPLVGFKRCVTGFRPK